MCPERSEKLIHQSDFTLGSKHWVELTGAQTRSFRRGGYYHIGANQTVAIRCVGVALTDFKVSVDAQFTDHSDQDAVCGIVFRVTEKYGKADTYSFFCVKRIGACALYIYDADEWFKIVEYKASEYINKDTGTNLLMVETVGQRITGSVNGHVLVRATDRRIARGDVGLIVSSTKEYYEARFRNLRLYSIERASVDENDEYSIEKVTSIPSAKTPSPGKPRVAEAQASAQRPSDFRTYLEGILKDAGMTDLTTDLREEMIQELSRSLNVFIIGEIVDHMPRRHLEAFTRLHEENRPQAEINRFIEEHMPNARQVFAEIFEKFRRQYVEKSGR